jgi:general stress protein 26
MPATQPETTLDTRFSSENATATPWEDARSQIDSAEVFWLTTVRPDGRPHVTTLLAVWHNDALHFCTGEDERKRRNLDENAHCALVTGCNTQENGVDLVVEGIAERVTDRATLEVLAAAWEAKYGESWHFDVGEGGFLGGGESVAWVYRVEPMTAFGFGKGDTFSQTRWRF